MRPIASVRATRAIGALVATMLVATGCSAAPVGSATTSSPVIASLAIPSQAPTPSLAAVATPTARPTATPLPTAFARGNDIPTDGSCQGGHPCLGLIAPGVHKTQLLEPGFSFTMPEAGWENIAMTPGEVALFRLSDPGDQVVFFTQPKLTKIDGSLDFSVPQTVEGITAWLAANPDLTVGPATDVTVGGLHGKRMTLMAAPTSTAHYPRDCPVATCVSLMMGRGPTWSWDWGIGSSERQRVDVLAAKDGIVLVFVDSIDGTTYDSLTKTADAILGSVKFDGS